MARCAPPAPAVAPHMDLLLAAAAAIICIEQEREAAWLASMYQTPGSVAFAAKATRLVSERVKSSKGKGK